MKKRILSWLLCAVLIVSLIPNQAYAVETDQVPAEEIVLEEIPAEEPVVEEVPIEESAAEEIPIEESVVEEIPIEESAVEEIPIEESAVEEIPAEEPVGEETPAEEPVMLMEPALEETPPQEVVEEYEKLCVEGCILTGEEHDECFVWVACTVTEGCEGPEGHEGECYGVALYADSSTLTITSGSFYNSFRNKYVVIADGSSYGVYYINNNGQVQTMNGTQATFTPGTYTIYYGPLGQMANRTFYKGSVTIDGTSASVTTSLSSARWSNATSAEKTYYALSIYYNTSSFDHVDVRVAGSYVLHVGNQTYSATVSSPSVVIKVGGRTVASQTWTNNQSYEWRKTGLSLNRSQTIEIALTLTLTYTDGSGQRHVLEDVEITYDNVNNLDKFLDAIIICDGVSGLDFRVAVEDIEEEIFYYTVTYDWKVVDASGNYTDLPVGAPSEPVATSGHAAGEQYIYDTEYVTGTSFYDYENGFLYSFHGWDTWSHSSEFNAAPGTGYTALDDGDTIASNNDTIEITDHTYIYGYWTVTPLEPADAYIVIDKVIAGLDDDAAAKADAELVWFRIDTGYDGDEDGSGMVDVDYSQIFAVKQTALGEYRLPVYQYDTPFKITEYNASVPGYTYTTTIAVVGDNAAGDATSGSTVNVTLEEVYQGNNVCLGAVTFTNTYTKNVGTPVNEYPEISLIKSAADSGEYQADVKFTLYNDEALSEIEAVYTTNADGVATIDFDAFDAGTYYLKETQALAGYVADESVYEITLAAGTPVEELRWNETAERFEFVQVTPYTVDVMVPDLSTSVYTDRDGYNRLHVYNSPILGQVTVKKTAIGLTDKTDLEATVIVHGPITRDAARNITDIGYTWTLTLNAENEWTDSATLSEMSLGEYLIHESFASVHGYTWSDVRYMNDAGVLNILEYNNINSGVFNVTAEASEFELTVENTYTVWEEADFYIYKIDDMGVKLPGAEFTLYTSAADAENGSNGVTKTTGADGFAHFNGFTLPEDSTEATYYLKETKAPAGFYLDETIYKVVITKPDGNAYDANIYTMDGQEAANYNHDTDLLTVTNAPVTGTLTITKTFGEGGSPEGLEGIIIGITGPDNFYYEDILDTSVDWKMTLTNLKLGEYVVTEIGVIVANEDAEEPDVLTGTDVPGYSVTTTYTVNEGTDAVMENAVVTLSETTQGLTRTTSEISGMVDILNTYTRNEEFFQVPTSLTIKKVDEDGETPLAGAVFTMERLDEEGNEVLASISFTTGIDGVVVFNMLSGFVTDGEPIDGLYRLTETKAPVGYVQSSASWMVKVVEDGDGYRVVLNSNRNIFENFWDWIVGDVSGNGGAKWTLDEETMTMTVQNVKKRGELTIIKAVEDEEEQYSDKEYTFTVELSDRTKAETITLKAGESYTFKNLPYETVFYITEDMTDAVFISENALVEGTIENEETIVEVVNTYIYDDGESLLTFVKVDEKTLLPLEGAEFTLYADVECEEALAVSVSDADGLVQFKWESAVEQTYYLKETKAPKGYQLSDTIHTVITKKAYTEMNNGTEEAYVKVTMTFEVAQLDGNEKDGFIITNAPVKEESKKDNDTPKTGDDFNGSVWGILGLSGFVGLLAALFMFIEKRRKMDK